MAKKLKMKDAEADLHVWKKPGDEESTDLYTISYEKMSICIDMPIDGALESLREHLESMSYCQTCAGIHFDR